MAGIEPGKAPPEAHCDGSNKSTLHRQNGTGADQAEDTPDQTSCCTGVAPKPAMEQASPLTAEESEWVQVLRSMLPTERAAALAAATALAHASAEKSGRVQRDS